MRTRGANRPSEETINARLSLLKQMASCCLRPEKSKIWGVEKNFGPVFIGKTHVEDKHGYRSRRRPCHSMVVTDIRHQKIGRGSEPERDHVWPVAVARIFYCDGTTIGYHALKL